MIENIRVLCSTDTADARLSDPGRAYDIADHAGMGKTMEGSCFQSVGIEKQADDKQYVF